MCQVDYTTQFILNTVVLPASLIGLVKITWAMNREDNDDDDGSDGGDEGGDDGGDDDGGDGGGDKGGDDDGGGDDGGGDDGGGDDGGGDDGGGVDGGGDDGGGVDGDGGGDDAPIAVAEVSGVGASTRTDSRVLVACSCALVISALLGGRAGITSR